MGPPEFLYKMKVAGGGLSQCLSSSLGLCYRELTVRLGLLNTAWASKDDFAGAVGDSSPSVMISLAVMSDHAERQMRATSSALTVN